jgi:hypothetical protein
MKNLLQLLVVFGVAIWLLSRCMGNDIPTPAPVAKSAAQVAAEKAADDRLARTVAGAKSIQAAMRDPDSFKLESADAYANGTICYVYRAKNGFGGYVREGAMLKPGATSLVKPNGSESAAWKKACDGDGVDLTAQVNRRL